MSDKIVKKMELSKEFLGAFEAARDRLLQYGVEGFTIGEYVDFLHSVVDQNQISEFIESKIPLKSKLLNALESGDESLLLELQKLIDRQSRQRTRRSMLKDGIDV